MQKNAMGLNGIKGNAMELKEFKKSARK